MKEPQHQHDCDECVFLGVHNKYDLYFCEVTPTVIARYGVDGDYISGLAFITSVPELAVAAVRAIAKGLLTDEQVQKATSA